MSARIVLIATWLLFACTVAAQPSFTHIDGRPAAFEDFIGKGHWTVVKFWASDCHVCNEEAHRYADLHQRRHADGIRLLGVSLDGPAGAVDAQAFVERHSLPYPNLLVPPGEGIALFESLSGRRWVGTPSFLVFRRDGKLLAEQAGAVPASVVEAFIAGHVEQ